MVYKYDSESNVLAVTLAKRRFAYAQEMGDFVVHFDQNDKPVYLEILNASKFLIKAASSLPKKKAREILQKFQAC